MSLTAQIPSKLTSQLVSKNQRSTDIIKLLLVCEKEAAAYSEILKKKFNKPNKIETCQDIWEFMKQQITYRKEPASKQTGKTLGRILHDKYGDCKAFATFAVAACRACSIPCNFRLASYQWNDKTPTHVYCVANVNGKEIILDGVLPKFNQEAPYKYAYNVKPLRK